MKKTIAIGITLLFIAVSIIPITTSLEKQTHVIKNNFSNPETKIIELGDCTNVSYILRYASNETVIDSSYEDWQNKTGDHPLHIFVCLNDSLPPTGFEIYSSEYVVGLIEGLVGLEESQTAFIDVPPEKGYGAHRLEIGDTFNTTCLTFSTYNNQTNYLVQVIDLGNENITIKWLDIENRGNFTMPEGILMEDLENANFSIYDPLPPYYIWENSSRIINITDDHVVINCTPASSTNISNEVLFATYADEMTFIFPDVTTASWNESQILINSTPIEGSFYTFYYEGVVFNITIGNVTSSHYNVTIEMGGQSQDILLNTTLEFARNYTMRRIFNIPLLYVQYTIGSDLEREGYSLHRLAGEELLYEVTVNKIFKTSQSNQPPYVPNTPFPENGAIDVSIDSEISWIGGDPDPEDTVTYDVYFGNTSEPPKVSAHQSETTYNPGILAYNTTYFWQIVAWDNHNESTTGPLWQFTIEEPPETIPPIVTLTAPRKNFLYINLNDIIVIKVPFITTWVIGQIDVTVDASDAQSGINRIEFLVDNNVKATDTTYPYSWTWDEPEPLFPYFLKVTAYDNAGNQNSKEIKVWKFL